ncbi:helix-turn-helix transcriptional regulator [Yoonia maritima]|uniref:helix-turn-helix transcriptional regulator n=1 Tax=Yoonia maritima TaxID=1435347 RepID=UPI00373689B4
MQIESKRTIATISRDELCHHLNIHRSSLKGVATHFSLEPQFERRYSWRQILRSIHDTNGALLKQHYEKLLNQHPDCAELKEIGDLEKRLKEPLCSFPEMATALGYKPDTMRRALHEGRLKLPFPEIALGKRMRRYRSFEVEFWCQTGLQLDLPEAPKFVVPETKEQPPSRAHRNRTANAFFGTFERKK